MGRLEIATESGLLLIDYTRQGVASIELPGSSAESHELSDRGYGDSEGKKNAELAGRLLKNFYEGMPVDFSPITVDLGKRSRFFRNVCAVVRDIKRGEVRSYKEVAVMAGSPGSARAVGRVMASNPVPLIIPCHRVVASDGSLTGYSSEGGIRTKRLLLEMEGVVLDSRGWVKR